MAEQAPTPNTSLAEARHRIFWVGLILALLGGQILLMLVMTYLATADASFAIEPDYYQKGIHWDAEVAQQRENARLAWELDFELGETASVFGERAFVCTLADADGRPLDGAAIDVVAFAHARGNERAAIVLTPAGDGRYESELRITRNGIWEFRFVVRRGPDTFTLTEQRGVEPPGGSRP
jgi:nitrogen fixation protein FixH